MEQYCAKPAKSERDVSATSLQVIPVMPALKQVRATRETPICPSISETRNLSPIPPMLSRVLNARRDEFDLLADVDKQSPFRQKC